MCENSSSRACSTLVGFVYFRGSPRILALQRVPAFREEPMSEEVYGPERAQRLVALLRALAERIQELDRTGRLLDAAPELQKLLGNARSELFHYEVRSTYDTPDVAESRRIVEEAGGSGDFSLDDPDDDEPWRGGGGGGGELLA